MIRDATERQEHVAGLVQRYRDGQLSETVFRVSLSFHLSEDEIRFVLYQNYEAHRQSLPYRRGDVA